MIKALLESVWLVYLVGAVLWGYLGLLAASSRRLPLVVGVLAGAFFWFLGVLVVYLVGFVRARAARLPRHPVGHRSTPALVAGLVAAGAVLVSIVLPWGSSRVAWSREQQHVSGSVQPLHFPPVTLAILLSGAVVAGVVLLDAQLRRGSWLAIGAIVVSFWFSLLIEWITLDRGLNSASHTVSAATGKTANLSFDAASGAWLMLTACIATYAWLTWRTAVLISERRTARAAPTPGWPPAQSDAPPREWGAVHHGQGWGISNPEPGTSQPPPQWHTPNQPPPPSPPNPGGGWGSSPGGTSGKRSPW